MKNRKFIENETNLITKNIEQIKNEDLQFLIDNSVLERKTIEYKQSLPGNSDSDKKEFLADVSSFANASGGDLIYGIIQEKDTGFPKQLVGLEIENVDREILRLESIVRDGIEPRIPSVYTRPIPLSNSKVALIIRVLRSWISPHRVSFKGHDKFYSRSSNGKYPLDVSELRIAFNLSETIIERIRRFRENRISKTYANETPVPFYDNAKIVLHLIPITAFDPTQSHDVQKIASQHDKLKPMICAVWDYRYNLDGFLTYCGGRSGKTHSYVQIFRNGIIEAVEGLLLKPQENELVIPGMAYEQELVKALPDYLSVLKAFNVGLPIFIFLTLIGVKGYSMAFDWRFWRGEVHTIDRDVLFLPEVVIENYEDRLEDILKPIFDSVWNSCGFPRSLNYDDNGKWNPKRA